MTPLLKSQAGNSLISVLMGLAIIGIVIAIGSQFTDNQLAVLAKVKEKYDLIDVRNFVRFHMDCAKTKASYGNCSPGKKVSLLSESNKDALAGFNSKKIEIQPVCVKKDTYQVKWRHKGSSDNWIDLFKVNIEC